MSKRNTTELLFDSEATLRLVDGALTDLRTSAQAAFDSTASQLGVDPMNIAGSPAAMAGSLADLSVSISELVSSLNGIRGGSSPGGISSIYGAGGRIAEAASPLEMLNGLGRAIALVDSAEVARTATAPDRFASILGDLRYELFSLMNCLQFQADVADRLSHAVALLDLTEARLMRIAARADRLCDASSPDVYLTAVPDGSAAVSDADRMGRDDR